MEYGQLAFTTEEFNEAREAGMDGYEFIRLKYIERFNFKINDLPIVFAAKEEDGIQYQLWRKWYADKKSKKYMQSLKNEGWTIYE